MTLTAIPDVIESTMSRRRHVRALFSGVEITVPDCQCCLCVVTSVRETQAPVGCRCHRSAPLNRRRTQTRE